MDPGHNQSYLDPTLWYDHDRGREADTWLQRQTAYAPLIATARAFHGDHVELLERLRREADGRLPDRGPCLDWPAHLAEVDPRDFADRLNALPADAAARWADVRYGRVARDHIATAHMRQAESWARRAHRLAPRVEVEALVLIAYSGLLDAIHGFDWRRPDVSFRAFARRCVLNAIWNSDEVRAGVPRRLGAYVRELRRAQHVLPRKLGRMPTIDEIATEIAQQELAKRIASERLTQELGREPKATEIAKRIAELPLPTPTADDVARWKQQVAAALLALELRFPGALPEEHEEMDGTAEQRLMPRQVARPLDGWHAAGLDDVADAVAGDVDSEGPLRTLTAAERQVVTARAEGYKEAEIAKMLGKSADAVKQLMHRARKKLAPHVGAIGAADDGTTSTARPADDTRTNATLAARGARARKSGPTRTAAEEAKSDA